MNLTQRILYNPTVETQGNVDGALTGKEDPINRDVQIPQYSGIPSASQSYEAKKHGFVGYSVHGSGRDNPLGE